MRMTGKPVNEGNAVSLSHKINTSTSFSIEYIYSTQQFAQIPLTPGVNG